MSPPADASRAPAREGFRQAMAWLHTWAGLLLGWLLFAIFVTGTLSYFKPEFNHWMRPELQALPPAKADDAAAVAERALAALRQHAPQATQWIMRLPDERQPEVSLLWHAGPRERFQTLLVHPATGDILTPRATAGGDFFYRFHFELRTAHQGRWVLQGRWIVGVATLLMFVALLTGVVTHRRIFKDFFTFRPAKGGQRAWLDAHNVSGVLALPFYLVITFSGLMIFHSLYLPAGIAAVYPGARGTDTASYFAELQGDAPRSAGSARAGPPAPLPPLAVAAAMQQAQAHWQGGRVQRLRAQRDPGGDVRLEVTRHDGDRLQYGPERLWFDGASGQLLHEAAPAGAARQTYGVLYGLHLARFAGPGLRWALFGFGVLGSLMIATGLVLWTVKRQAQARRPHARQPQRLPFGERLVASLNLAALAGLPLALAVYLAANRLLPLHWAARADAELACFFSAWALALLLAAVSPGRRGWCALLALAGALWALLPLLNAAATHAHLGVSLPARDWVLAGMDLAFLATGALLLALAYRLRPLRAPASARPPAAVPAHLTAARGHRVGA
ncbi:PepSY-associated TM helix domain-containing protein [Diaphorobacter nitroreducens]|uniref:PepSY-associated TM helix domain-containing protein n=1 Tax=Diaphorobacter nitroreducens TaxID=164759 RepID=UPI00289CBE6D|nr:PepSY-associated TM helix domain-containing protein [Diaphorobacter nitroreducens]